jgi:hypothetical protein
LIQEFGFQNLFAKNEPSSHSNIEQLYGAKTAFSTRKVARKVFQQENYFMSTKNTVQRKRVATTVPKRGCGSGSRTFTRWRRFIKISMKIHLNGSSLMCNLIFMNRSIVLRHNVLFQICGCKKIMPKGT